MTVASVRDASAEGAVSSSSFVDLAALIRAGRTSDGGADFGAGVANRSPVPVASIVVADGVPSVAVALELLPERHRWAREALEQQ